MSRVKKIGGLVLDKITTKQIYRENVFGFGAEEPIKPLGKWENLKQILSDKWLYQGSLPACVTLGVCYVNSYNSKINNDNNVQFLWGWLFDNTPSLAGGRRVSDVLELLRKRGVPQDKFMPQANYLKLKNEGGRLKTTEEMEDDLKNWKIKSWTRLKDVSRQGIYTALKSGPVLIGVPGTNAAWTSDYIKYKGASWLHLTTICDVAEDGDWLLVNGWKNGVLDTRKMDKNHPISSAYTIEDLPDEILINKNNARDMFKIVRSKQTGKIFLIDPKDVKHYITSPEGLSTFFSIEQDSEEWKRIVEDVDDEQIAVLPEGMPFEVKNSVIAEVIKREYPELNDSVSNLKDLIDLFKKFFTKE